MVFKSHFESDEQETARLAAAPEGSRNHDLSKLPVVTPHVIRAEPLRLALFPDNVVVVPLTYHRSISRRVNDEGLREWDGTWDVMVIASDNPATGVGSHDLSIPLSQLRRSPRVKFAPPASS